MNTRPIRLCTFVLFALLTAALVLPAALRAQSASGTVALNTPAETARHAHDADVQDAERASSALVHYGMPPLRKALPRVRYPESARSFRREGRVVASFTVDARGRAQEAEVLRGFFAPCDEEVLRVLRLARFEAVSDSSSRAPGTRYVVSFSFTL